MSISTRAGPQAPTTPPPEAYRYGSLLPSEVETFPPGVGVFAQSDWLEAWQSVGEGEVDYEIDEVEGTIPPSLIGGSLYRLGPGRFERGGKRYEHVLDGDGFMLKIDLSEDGRHKVKGKFVETFWYEDEDKDDAIKYRNTFGSQPEGLINNMMDLELKNVANTNGCYWGGKLHALWEAGAPHELDVDTLATKGPSDLGGLVGLGPEVDGRAQPVDTGLDIVNNMIGMGASAFTAHPHVDPLKKRLVSKSTPLYRFVVTNHPNHPKLTTHEVGWTWTNLPRADSMRLAIREWDEAWAVQEETTYVMEGAALAPHDFTLTPSYYLFMENQMSMDLVPYVLGAKGPAQTLTMKLNVPVRLHVVPRPGSAAAERGEVARVLDCPPWFCIHLSHATERSDGSGLSIYGSGWPKAVAKPDGSPPEFLGAWGGEAPTYDKIPVTNYWETKVDLVSGRVVSHEPCPSSDFCVEHPHVHPEYEGAFEGDGAPRYAFMSCSNSVGLSTAPQGWVRTDLVTGETKVHWIGTRHFTEEVVVVPKGKGDPYGAVSQGGEEGAGEVGRMHGSAECWVLGLVYDAKRKCSALRIVDGETMEAVATLWLKHVSPHGLHGSWRPARS